MHILSLSFPTVFPFHSCCPPVLLRKFLFSLSRNKLIVILSSPCQRRTQELVACHSSHLNYCHLVVALSCSKRKVGWSYKEATLERPSVTCSSVSFRKSCCVANVHKWNVYFSLLQGVNHNLSLTRRIELASIFITRFMTTLNKRVCIVDTSL